MNMGAALREKLVYKQGKLVHRQEKLVNKQGISFGEHRAEVLGRSSPKFPLQVQVLEAYRLESVVQCF